MRICALLLCLITTNAYAGGATAPPKRCDFEPPKGSYTIMPVDDVDAVARIFCREYKVACPARRYHAATVALFNYDWTLAIPPTVYVPRRGLTPREWRHERGRVNCPPHGVSQAWGPNAKPVFGFNIKGRR